MSLTNENFFELYDIKPPFVDAFFAELENKYGSQRDKFRGQCPACGDTAYGYAFQKNNAHYVKCGICATLYVQNGISEKASMAYSKEVYAFLNTDAYVDHIKKRANDTLFHFELTLSRLFSFRSKNISIGYSGNRFEAFQELLKSNKSVELSRFDDKEKYDLIVLNNSLEGKTEVHSFLDDIKSSLKPNGFLYVTARVGSGIDILTLKEDSNIYPIEHMNLFSVEGFRQILNKNFMVKELSTPGVLDVELILNSKREEIPEFLRYMRKKRDINTIKDFQLFIQKHLLSSFLIVIAQRIEE